MTTLGNRRILSWMGARRAANRAGLLLLTLAHGCVEDAPPPRTASAPPYAHQHPGYAQPGYGRPPPPPGYAQPGYAQPGYPQPGYPQPGYARPGYPQPPPGPAGYPQPGYGYPPPPAPGYGHPGQAEPPRGQAGPSHPQAPQTAGPPPVPPPPVPPPAQPPAQPPAPSPALPNVAVPPGIELTGVQGVGRRARAKYVLDALIQSLPPAYQGRVRNIPLVFDDRVGEVNAFAACVDGAAAMALTDGILQISGELARARSYDEILGTQKTAEYISLIARTRKQGRPLSTPYAGFYPASEAANPSRVARELTLFDEQIAFILGHELAHHYLGHLPCTARSGVPISEITRALSTALPAFNQPNEIGSDVAGVNNLLTAGKTHGWNEEGAILTLDFFSGLQSFSAGDILFGFERSHPAPQIRRPIVHQAANAWRATGGRGVPVLGF